jgi:hypothetical protein
MTETGAAAGAGTPASPGGHRVIRGTPPGPSWAAEPGTPRHFGTPLAKKIGIKPGHRVLLTHAPAGWHIPGLPPGAVVSRRADAAGTARGPDVTILFCRSRRQLESDLPLLIASLPAGGALWIAWPRRAAGHSSDVTENGLRDAALPFGVVDVKVAALDHDWSGLKFVWRKKQRA